MGIDRAGLRFLLASRRAGVDFGATATLGRQELFLEEAELTRALGAYGVPSPPGAARGWLAAEGRPADGLLRHLGARAVTSFDADAYEGADVVADLNEPLDPRWHGRFSAVVDGGTLEHVFDLPQALRSSMELVRPGGHLLTITTADGYFGHGFYQVSAELFFRVLRPGNGFALRGVLLCDDRGHWFEVVDGGPAGRRADLCAPRPTLIHVLAQRTSATPPGRLTAQQGDYAQAWRGAAPAAPPPPEPRRRRWGRVLRGDRAYDPRSFRRVRP